MSKKQNHVHKLKRHKYPSGNHIYFCTQNCSFKVECKLALGHESICNMCLQPFTMNEYSIKLKLPHCDSCSKRKIKDAEGKVRYVRTNPSKQVLTSVAESTTNSLADRLKASIQSQMEDDI